MPSKGRLFTATRCPMSSSAPGWRRTSMRSDVSTRQHFSLSSAATRTRCLHSLAGLRMAGIGPSVWNSRPGVAASHAQCSRRETIAQSRRFEDFDGVAPGENPGRDLEYSSDFEAKLHRSVGHDLLLLRGMPAVFERAVHRRRIVKPHTNACWLLA